MPNPSAAAPAESQTQSEPDARSDGRSGSAPTQAESRTAHGAGGARGLGTVGPEDSFELEFGEAVEASLPPPPTEEQHPATSIKPPGYVTLLSRDEEPNPSNPLTYRERSYLAPEEAGTEEVRRFMLQRVEELRQQLAHAGRGRFVNLAAFDHHWTEQPRRPPFLVVQWKDWQGEPVVSFPGTRKRPSDAPQQGQDERLADAFEALQDLAFLRTPREGLDFVIKLLATTAPAEAGTAYLYDIDTDELRVVIATGPGAEARRGTAISLDAGLVGAAARAGKPLAVADLEAHARFDPGADGRPGTQPRSTLLCPLVHDSHLVGMLQLLNRRGATRFSKGDAHIVHYIGTRLAEFLYETRMRRSDGP